jgi:hypothetical protein
MQVLGSFLRPFPHSNFVSLVAHLQPFRGTLGELKWSSPSLEATFFAFFGNFGTFQTLTFKDLIAYNN